jgi:hypothetical protein
MRRTHAVVNSYAFKYHLNLFSPLGAVYIIGTHYMGVFCVPRCTAGRDYAGRAPVAAAHEKQHIYYNL